jgi:antitoxin component YwqK of YwqJK toxin-antitoxin module
VMIERFADGLAKSRSAVLGGRLHGVSEGWHTNGQLQVLEHFTDGVSNGLRIKYYPNGQKQSEAHVVAGQLHGVYRRWHANGQLAEQIEFRSGKPEGVSLAYFETGFLKTRTMSRSGAVVDRQTWKDGEAGPPASN